MKIVAIAGGENDYLYDKFYASKKYDKEVEFIKYFITDMNAIILDAGCGCKF